MNVVDLWISSPSQEHYRDVGGTKKPRKPYTMSKPRESWTDQEHQKFVEALKLYRRDWKRVQAHVATKTAVQVGLLMNIQHFVCKRVEIDREISDGS